MKKLALLAALCGCASVPMARKDLDQRAKDLKAPPDAANVYVYRPSAIVFGVAVNLTVFLDETRVGTLRPGTFAVLTVPPGEHKLTVRAWSDIMGYQGSNEQPVVIEPGRSYYVKTAPGWNSGPALELIADEASGAADVRDCSLIASTAAETIRTAAAEIAKVNVDAVGEDALLAAATRALDAMAGAPAPPPTGDIDASVAAVHAARPGLSERQVVTASVAAMLQSLSSTPRQDERWLSRAMDLACGLVLRRDGHEVIVASVLPESPAAQAKVEAGLELREVNGLPTRDHAPVHAVELLAGPPGTEVALTVGRPGESDRELVLRRAAADAGALDCRVLNGNVLYLHPWQLSPATARRIRDRGRSAGAASQRVILDLRDTDYGTVDGATDLSDSFLAQGTILAVAGGRIAGLDKTYTAQAKTSALEEAEVVVLVNGNTTGVAEALAAAVQDNRRGTVLGTRTAGEGKIFYRRTVAGYELRIPMARMVRATGKPIQDEAVVPYVIETASAPAAGQIASDVACPGIASPTAVSNDPLVRRAVHLLLSDGG